MRATSRLQAVGSLETALQQEGRPGAEPLVRRFLAAHAVEQAMKVAALALMVLPLSVAR